MDPITHALTGTAVSDSWFRRRLGPAATPFSLIMAALPDIDIVAFFISVESAWANHRGLTHSFFPQLVAAPFFGYAGYRLSGRRGTWGLWCLLAALCLFSHTLLDLATSWGTMPLRPFSNARISWDIAPILDLFVLSLGAASFVVNRVLRRERVDHFINPLAFPVEHRHPHRQRAADIIGKVAVALIVVYLAVGCLQNRQTVRVAREELAKQGITSVDVRALPIMFTYIAWNIAARDADGDVYNAAYSSYAPGPMRFVEHRTLPEGDVRAIVSSPLGALFAWYTQG
ncbi:MAG: metal-dependent hydrolase, partial [Planctomycetota bacterium]|nr:metal-dependent hydrolase [Planctomycetota bacterium]